jgi:hypothetical protein
MRVLLSQGPYKVKKGAARTKENFKEPVRTLHVLFMVHSFVVD